MGKEENIFILKALDHYISNIVDGRIAYHAKQNKCDNTHESVYFLSSQPLNIILPFGWHPEKTEKLKTLHRFLLCFGMIICEYAEFETHFIGRSNGKILWIGTQTELMYLILALINPPLKLVSPPAKNNLNIKFRFNRLGFTEERMKYLDRVINKTKELEEIRRKKEHRLTKGRD